MNKVENSQRIYPIMAKGTAKWLVENTSLTFEQIADFCGLHSLEVQGIADEEVAIGMRSVDPTLNGQLTEEEINRCEQDPKLSLRMASKAVEQTMEERKLKKRYTPIAKRQDKPSAIAWIVKNYPDAADSQIVKLIGTTKKTIEGIRDKSHWNYANIKPKDPVLLGLCSQADLNYLIEGIKKESDADKK